MKLSHIRFLTPYLRSKSRVASQNVGIEHAEPVLKLIVVPEVANGTDL